MPTSLLEKVALAGWNDTDPLSLAKARAVLQVVREEIEVEYGRPTRAEWYVGRAESLDHVLARFPEESE